jgi:hypothetical protein
MERLDTSMYKGFALTAHGETVEARKAGSAPRELEVASEEFASNRVGSRQPGTDPGQAGAARVG